MILLAIYITKLQTVLFFLKKIKKIKIACNHLLRKWVLAMK